MENKKQSLPSNIDDQILKMSRNMINDFASIAEGWSMLTATIASKNKRIEELEASLAEPQVLTAQSVTDEG